MHNSASQPWAFQLKDLMLKYERVVMVTVAQTKGSTPRETGARLFVTPQGIVGTIGGGNLEFKACKIAQDMLSGLNKQRSTINHFSLAAGLGMCCGGVVEVIFEVIDSNDLNWLFAWVERHDDKNQSVLVTVLKGDSVNKLLVNKISDLDFTLTNNRQIIDFIDNEYHSFRAGFKFELIKINDTVCYIETLSQQKKHLYLFGAGHVGQAIIKQMSDLPWQITWVDTRDDCLAAISLTNKSTHVNLCITESPEAEIAQAKIDSYFLVMTHDHALDLVLCEHILKRDDYCYFGLIGSKTKRQRFEHRLMAKGYEQQQLNKMICPIGITGINSKQASLIAVSVVAQLVQQNENRLANQC